MKVLVFPALLAVAIITTPPKPFAAAETGKALTTRSSEQSTPLTGPAKQAGKSQEALPPLTTKYTARR